MTPLSGKMAFSTINLETLRSLTEECKVNGPNKSLTEGSDENESLTEGPEETPCLNEGSGENRNDAGGSKTKQIECKVRQLLPIPNELWRRSAVSRF